jgi:hypothetical protein
MRKDTWLRRLIKLEIINNPGLTAQEVADKAGVSIRYVNVCRIQLGIQRSTRPKHYVG